MHHRRTLPYINWPPSPVCVITEKFVVWVHICTLRWMMRVSGLIWYDTISIYGEKKYHTHTDTGSSVVDQVFYTFIFYKNIMHCIDTPNVCIARDDGQWLTFNQTKYFEALPPVLMHSLAYDKVFPSSVAYVYYVSLLFRKSFIENASGRPKSRNGSIKRHSTHTRTFRFPHIHTNAKDQARQHDEID